jgi:hypothetical protein
MPFGLREHAAGRFLKERQVCFGSADITRKDHKTNFPCSHLKKAKAKRQKVKADGARKRFDGKRRSLALFYLSSLFALLLLPCL